MNKKFAIEICSDLDFNGMVVDISYDTERIASINYEKGINAIEIELLSGKEGVSKRVFPLNDFLRILEEAKAIAIRCAQEDDLRDQ